MIIVHGRANCAPCKTICYLLDKKGFSYKYVEGGAEIYPTLKVGDKTVVGLNWPRINSLLSTLGSL